MYATNTTATTCNRNGRPIVYHKNALTAMHDAATTMTFTAVHNTRRAVHTRRSSSVVSPPSPPPPPPPPTLLLLQLPPTSGCCRTPSTSVTVAFGGPRLLSPSQSPRFTPLGKPLSTSQSCEQSRSVSLSDIDVLYARATTVFVWLPYRPRTVVGDTSLIYLICYNALSGSVQYVMWNNYLSSHRLNWYRLQVNVVTS